MRILVKRMTVCIAVACAAGGARAALNPVARDGETIVFDAEIHDCRQVGGTAPGRAADDDLVVQRRGVTHDGRKSLEVTCSGRRGSAGVSFSVGEIPAPPEGTVHRGIRMAVDYRGAVIRKLAFFFRFQDGKTYGERVSLEPGQEALVVRTGSRDWSGLKTIALNILAQNSPSDFSFLVQRISLVAEEKTPENRRVLKLGAARNVQEIFPLAGPVTVDGRFSEAAWGQAVELPDYHYYKGARTPAAASPFRVRAAYDEKTLYLALRAEFPSAPRATVMEPDGRVFADEPQEVFFNAANDNDRKIQFAVNAAGTVFDYVREFDLAAQRVLTQQERNVAHTKQIRYENGIWSTEIAFPFEAIGFDPNAARYLGFQVAQNYLKRPDERLRTLAWNETSFFPAPAQFGVLVFNSRPFGPGRVEVRRVSREAREDSLVDFFLDCTLSGFTPGAYRASSTLTVHGRTKTMQDAFSVGADGTVSRTFRIEGAWNEEGTYMWHLAVANPAGDLLVVPVTFANVRDLQDQFGRRLLLPKPKQVVWAESAFRARKNNRLFLPPDATPRTRKTAEIFARKYFDCTGVRLQADVLAGGAAGRGVTLQIAPAAMFQGRLERLRKEGYCLVVEPDRVLITGADEPGLYFGMITLFQLVRHSMRMVQDIPIPCVEILDWPDLPVRLCRLEIYSGRHTIQKERRDIDDLIDWTDRWVAAAKLNLLMIDLSAAVRYTRHPEVNNGSDTVRYSREELQRFAQYCRDNFVQLCPAWQIGGHEGCWLLHSHPEFTEKGWPGQGNLALPDRKKIVFDCMLDVIEALNPEYVSPKGDEYWHHAKEAKQEPDPLLNGKSRAQVFLDFHLDLHAWLKRQGIKMALYHDMLSPYHNGTRYDVYKVVDKLPRDIAIMLWSNNDQAKQIAWFAERGFPVWLNGTSIVMADEPAGRNQISGAGQSIYNWGHDRDGNGGKDEMVPWKSMYSILRGADYAWNAAVEDGEGWHTQIKSGRLVTLRHIFAVRDNPYAGEAVEPVDMTGQFNQSFGAFLRDAKPETYPGAGDAIVLPAGPQEVGFIPMQFAARPGRNAVILRKNSEPVALPVGRACSSLIFLHGGYINDPKDLRRLHLWPYGTPCGMYVVHYADGTKETVPLRMHANIKSLDCKAANRATLENRYVLTLKDRNQNDIHLQQLEWVNPKPSTPVEKVVVAHDGEYDVSLVLVALSSRSIWAGADGEAPMTQAMGRR
ncbi:MAG: hypothetical protein JXR37_15165 [Kiritimatiellae bacterium]|nr:hypothetical protein [Kiritimatiellia bacterium]